LCYSIFGFKCFSAPPRSCKVYNKRGLAPLITELREAFDTQFNISFVCLLLKRGLYDLNLSGYGPGISAGIIVSFYDPH